MSRDERDKRERTMSDQKTSQNSTYERALAMFFEDGPSQEQQSELPSEVDGLSVRRKAMINAVHEARHETERLHALKLLYAQFGLPHQIQIIALALTSEDEALSLEALRILKGWIASHLEMGEEGRATVHEWSAHLESRLEHLMIRSFHEEIQTLSAFCQRELKRAAL